MRKLLLATAMLGGLATLTSFGAAAAPVTGANGWQGQPASSVVQADWYWHHRHWHHRRWERHHWHYWD